MTAMKEIEVGGNTYRLGTIPALTQLNVARRIMPLVAALTGSIGEEEETKPDEANGEDRSLVALGRVTGPMLEAFAKMTDEDVEYVIEKCLKDCHRKQPTGWAKVMTGKQFMFGDLRPGDMIQLAIATIQENMLDFSSSSPPA